MSALAVQSGFFDLGPQQLAHDGQGGIRYLPGIVDAAQATEWFELLRERVAWQAMRRPMYDRVVDVPRLVCAYRLEDPAVPAPIGEIAARVRAELGEPFNTVGLNHYRDGRDSVAPHNDKLHTLVPGHPIALLSLGSTRCMTIRAKAAPRTAIRIELAPGSLLVMSYDSQLHYDHGIPKTRGKVPPRMSLAFRVRPVGAPSRSTDRILQPASPPD